jgi:hypothetical protein
MVEDKDKGWWALIEKQGLHRAADILEKYGIGSATEVSDLEKDDFSELEASCWYINFWVRRVRRVRVLV